MHFSPSVDFKVMQHMKESFEFLESHRMSWESLQIVFLQSLEVLNCRILSFLTLDVLLDREVSSLAVYSLIYY